MQPFRGGILDTLRAQAACGLTIARERYRSFRKLGFRVSGFRVLGLGFRVSGFRVLGLGFSVHGFGPGVSQLLLQDVGYLILGVLTIRIPLTI